MAQVLDLTSLLQSAQSADFNLRTQGEQQLRQLQDGQYPVFLASLAAELSNSDKPSDTRRLAGLILKNALDAKEEQRKACGLPSSPDHLCWQLCRGPWAGQNAIRTPSGCPAGRTGAAVAGPGRRHQAAD